jgi:hypothetical protein
MVQDNSLSSRDNELFELGKKQWACLDSLAKHYTNADMSSISLSSNFHDDEWDAIGNNSYNFRWKEWSTDENAFPLILILKVMSYHSIQVNNLSISTIQTGVVGFINCFIETLQAKSICIAKRDQAFNMLSHLSSDDITLNAQTNLGRKGNFGASPFSTIDRISTISVSAYPNSEFLISGISRPWNEQGIEYLSWCKTLKQNFGIDTSKKSYPPLKSEVVSAIVKSAIPFVNEFFDTIVGVFDEIAAFDKTSNYSPSNSKKLNYMVSSIIQKKYGKKLKNILPIKLYEAEHQLKGRITYGWYTELEQLAQGAAAWIILLTTGLRNLDMRNLKKGCCQPSKRNDLLNYLVTDIQKVNLIDYVLPVPHQTEKAVQLLELAKIDRTGSFLLTKISNKSIDNTTSDKRKMNAGGTFNSMIKSFTNHYDISLQTILDDDKEATAHCVRATLAGYIGTNSTAAILILKKLFGHSNALMPDAYLSHNPLVINERNKNITIAQETLAEDMANGMVSGKLSGVKGKQMLDGAEYSRNELAAELNESLTEMDMNVRLKERFKEMLLSRIQTNSVYALKTPMSVVCMRNCSDSSDTPCAKLGNHEKRKESGVSKAISDSLATLPNPSQCIGKECSDALFGEAWSRDLLNTFDYYIKYLKGAGYQSIDIKHEAELFVKNYGSIMKDIYAEERDEGYFD